MQSDTLLQPERRVVNVPANRRIGGDGVVIVGLPHGANCGRRLRCSRFDESGRPFCWCSGNPAIRSPARASPVLQNAVRLAIGVIGAFEDAWCFRRNLLRKRIAGDHFVSVASSKELQNATFRSRVHFIGQESYRTIAECDKQSTRMGT